MKKEYLKEVLVGLTVVTLKVTEVLVDGKVMRSTELVGRKDI